MELRHIGSGDLDRSAGARIASRTGGAGLELKRTEADQRQLFIGLDGFNNSIENGLQNASGFGLRKFFGSCDLFNELLTIHKRFSFNRQLWANARPADF